MCMLEALRMYVNLLLNAVYNTYVHMWFHKLHVYIDSGIIFKLLICPNLIRMYVVFVLT